MSNSQITIGNLLSCLKSPNLLELSVEGESSYGEVLLGVKTLSSESHLLLGVLTLDLLPLPCWPGWDVIPSFSAGPNIDTAEVFLGIAKG